MVCYESEASAKQVQVELAPLCRFVSSSVLLCSGYVKQM